MGQGTRDKGQDVFVSNLRVKQHDVFLNIYSCPPSPVPRPFFLLFSLFFFLFSCTFDYGDLEPVESTMPDLVMENVNYVRVESAKPVARFQADRAERFEKQRLMKLENVTFEQFGGTIEEVNATGFAENAAIEIDTGNISMEDSVVIEVESEDIVLQTQHLEWKDDPRTLSSRAENEIVISMSNGSRFAGFGFFADARRRTWEFLDNVTGTFIFDDEEETAEEEKAGEIINE